MDRLKQLESYTVRELVDELKRRKDELDAALAIITGTGDSPVKNSRMSEAKAAYWKEWHEFKKTHPDSTVDQWRRSQKRGSKK